MEPESSLPHLRMPAICPYPETRSFQSMPPYPTSWRSPNLMSLFHCLGHTKKSISPGPRHLFMSRNYASFYVEELLGHRPNPKLEDHPLSAFRDWLFNTFAAALHIGGRSPIRNLRTRHAEVTGTHLSRVLTVLALQKALEKKVGQGNPSQTRYWILNFLNTK
jgi:hypothetical protein